MENNLEDILVDSIETKPSTKSKARMIIIAIASIVLIAVLGILAYVLLKKETPKNPEFNNSELEKIVPTQPQQDEFDKLIAEIKHKDTLVQQAPVSNEIQPQESTTPNKEEKSVIQQSDTSKIQKKEEKKEEKNTQEIAQAPKPMPKEEKVEKAPIAKPAPKKEEPKKIVEKKETKPIKDKKPAPSASKAFESVKTATAPKGFYLQVGVFGGKPQNAFISKIAPLQYKTETIQKGGKVLTRYLVGPYKTKNQAENMIFDVMQTLGIKPIVVEIK